MRFKEMCMPIFKGKRVQILKDSDAGQIKGFLLKALSEKGIKAIRYMRKSISKKDVKGRIITEEPLIIEFKYSDSFSKSVGEKTTKDFIGLLLKGQGCSHTIDYDLEVIRR